MTDPSSSTGTENQFISWISEHAYDIIWIYNTILSTITTLFILINMFIYQFTLGSITMDLLTLCLFPLTVLLWEAIIYFGENIQSVALLGLLCVLNLIPYIAAVYVLSVLWNERSYVPSRRSFAIIIIISYTAFITISEIYLYWKIWRIRQANAPIMSRSSVYDDEIEEEIDDGDD